MGNNCVFMHQFYGQTQQIVAVHTVTYGIDNFILDRHEILAPWHVEEVLFSRKRRYATQFQNIYVTYKYMFVLCVQLAWQ